jgi:hypothetical protein
MLVRPHRAHRGQCGLLIGGIGVGVDQHDRDRSGPLGQQRAGRSPYLLAVHGRADCAIGERALPHLEAQVAVDHRHEVAPQAPGVAAVAPAHLQHVAEAARGDEPDAPALALQQGIGADRRAVHDRAKALRCVEALQPGEEADRLVPAVRRHLGRAEGAGSLVVEEEVGERATDIHADDGS